MASNDNLSPSEDNSSGTNLSDILTENKDIDTTNWTLAKHKKLQHMKEFHEEYQQVFGEKASIWTIIKNRILNMNPPMHWNPFVGRKCKVQHRIMKLSSNI